MKVPTDVTISMKNPLALFIRWQASSPDAGLWLQLSTVAAVCDATKFNISGITCDDVRHRPG